MLLLLLNCHLNLNVHVNCVDCNFPIINCEDNVADSPPISLLNSNVRVTPELSCRARGSPQPKLEWRVRDRPVLSSHLVDVTMADTEYSEKTVRIRGARRGNEVRQSDGGCNQEGQS